MDPSFLPIPFEPGTPLPLASSFLPLQEELFKVAQRFEREHIKNSIVFFGSARILSPEQANERFTAVEAEIQKALKRTPDLESKLKRAQQDCYMAQFYQAADELAYRFTDWSLRLTDPKEAFLLCSGGGPGIMEACNKGAHRAGGRSIGLSISIPFEQQHNAYISPELSFHFNTFFFRKFWFFYCAKAIVVFPGGLGTLDELFQFLTSMKTGKSEYYVPTVLFSSTYWKTVLNFEAMIEYGTISASDLNFFKYSDSIEDTFSYITQELDTHYISRY